MKTIVVKTKKVVSHKENGEAVYEETRIPLSPELTFNKFVKYIHNQGYVSVDVIEVLDNGKSVDEVDKYNKKIQEVLRPKSNPGQDIDYKALSEKQNALLQELQERLSLLEDKSNNKTESRIKLEAKANDLNISFRANIGDEKLLEKIKEIEPEFEV